LIYGVVVAVALFAALQFYVTRLLHLPAPNSSGVFLLFAAIIAYKSYSSTAFVVLGDTSHLVWGTTISGGTAVLVGGITSLAVDPSEAVNTYAAVCGFAMVTVLFWNVPRLTVLMPTDHQSL
jgi:uncharacterized membrane protein